MDGQLSDKSTLIGGPLDGRVVHLENPLEGEYPITAAMRFHADDRLAVYENQEWNGHRRLVFTGYEDPE